MSCNKVAMTCFCTRICLELHVCYLCMQSAYFWKDKVSLYDSLFSGDHFPIMPKIVALMVFCKFRFSPIYSNYSALPYKGIHNVGTYLFVLWLTYKETRIWFRFRRKKMRFPKITGEARPQLPHMTSRHCAYIVVVDRRDRSSRSWVCT